MPFPCTDVLLSLLDYVLAYQKEPGDDKGEMRRKEFEKNLKRAGLKLEYEDNTVRIYLLLVLNLFDERELSCRYIAAK